MEPVQSTLRMWQQPSGEPPLDWSWVDEQLDTSGTYWLIAGGGAAPHPRPVWGVWSDLHLHLSIGSPALRSAAEDGPVTVHLDSAIDVVIVDGTGIGSTADAELIAAYDRKYDWSYDPEEYGPLTSIRPQRVIAWQSVGWAGRDGFRATGRWTLAI